MPVVLPDDAQGDHDPSEVSETTEAAAPTGLLPKQKCWFAILIVANVLVWLIPSHVARLIADDRPTLLGHYSRTHFTWNIVVAVISMMGWYINLGVGVEHRRRWFRVIASLCVIVPTLIVADFFMRSPAQSHYIRDSIAYHRPAHFSIEQVYEDKPVARRTYPEAPPGFHAVDCTLTTDARGYRNVTDLATYDVVALGDSFTEGSSVSDEHPWPVRLHEKTGLSVYNLGMSGYDPFHYLESLKAHGLSLRPRFVVCMIYEGNDFRSAKSDRKRRTPSLSAKFKRYIKQSPVVNALDRLMVGTFGPINADGPVSHAETISWMPLMIPKGGPASRAYAFAPKQLRDLYMPEDLFAQDRHWLNPRAQLAKMNELCEEAGVRFFVVFAPTKAHVTLPLVAHDLEAGPVRAFTKYKYKGALPEAEPFLQELLSRVESREHVVQQWCVRESIPFIDLTDALRRDVSEGRQAYYSYDQHWTPIGHDTAATEIAARLQDATHHDNRRDGAAPTD